MFSWPKFLPVPDSIFINIIFFNLIFNHNGKKVPENHTHIIRNLTFSRMTEQRTQKW